MFIHSVSQLVISNVLSVSQSLLVSHSVISNFLSVSQSASWPTSELVGGLVGLLASLQNKRTSQSISHFFSQIWTCKKYEVSVKTQIKIYFI